MIRLALIRMWVIFGVLGAVASYSASAEGAVGILASGLVGFCWGTLLAQESTEYVRPDVVAPRRRAVTVYAVSVYSLLLPVVGFSAALLVGGRAAVALGVASVLPAPTAGHLFARLAIDDPSSRARRLRARSVLFRHRRAPRPELS